MHVYNAAEVQFNTQLPAVDKAAGIHLGNGKCSKRDEPPRFTVVNSFTIHLVS